MRTVFAGTVVLPQSLAVGPLRIRFYGLVLAAAVGAGLWLAARLSEKFHIEKKYGDEIIFWTIVGGFVGARLYHVVSQPAFYLAHPAEIAAIWHGGLSIYGAVLGGLLAVAYCSKKYGLPLLRVLNWLTPSLLLGQIIGRFGNFFNYELFGYPTELPWKMFVPVPFRPEGYGLFSYFHPLFLYEAAANLITLIFLLAYAKKGRQRYLFFLYLILYNVVRFFLEFLRIESTYAGAVRVNAVVSAVAAVAAVSFLVAFRRSRP